jgi:hypothetical protein
MRTQQGVLAIVGLLMVSCGLLPAARTATPPPDTSGVSAEGTASAAEPAPAPGTPVADAVLVEPGVLTLKVWMVEVFAPASDTPGGEALCHLR